MTDFSEAIKGLIDVGHKMAGVDIGNVEDFHPSKAPLHFFLSVPDGITTTDITEKVLARLATPRRRKGHLTMLSPRSLVDYVNRYVVDGQTAIFADTANRKVTAILNYHEPTEDALDAEAALEGGDADSSPAKGSVGGPAKAKTTSAQWGDFRCSYAFPLSRQWRTWTASNDKPQTQADLAHFLEDNIRDIADPGTTVIPEKVKMLIERLNLHVGTPARLLETARGMEIRSTENVRQAINTDTGEQVITYEQEHLGGGNPTLTELRVPTAFLLAIPVFQNDAPYLLLCRLRYRKVGAGVNWIISLQGIEASLEHAFAEGCDTIQEGTGVPLFYSSEPPGVAP
jgi:uncharacterized protein YfdQ (DUF2303 family)